MNLWQFLLKVRAKNTAFIRSFLARELQMFFSTAHRLLIGRLMNATWHARSYRCQSHIIAQARTWPVQATTGVTSVLWVLATPVVQWRNVTHLCSVANYSHPALHYAAANTWQQMCPHVYSKLSAHAINPAASRRRHSYNSLASSVFHLA